MFIFFLILFSTYTFLQAILFLAWNKSTNNCNQKSTQETFISIIIPIRNEALHIEKLLESIANQNYPLANFEVIVVNDQSDDSSVEIIEQFIQKNKIKLILLHLDNSSSESPKKKAINTAIKVAKGELIVTTDGDCLATEYWLSSIEQLYKSKNAKLISAPVTYFDQNNIWNAFQIIELASLVGTGASTLNLQKPTMCNGANLAYPKSVFLEVNGFEGNQHLASGDDEFLMHKIAKKHPKDLYFLKNNQAIIQTFAPNKLSTFYHQRKRWASKWRYQNSITSQLTAIFVFAVNASWLLILGLMVSNKLNISYLYLVLGLKSLPEILLLANYLLFFKQSKKIKYIPILQVIYPLYVIIFGVLSWRKGYIWKERKLN
ncbi:MAG: glycosyltransferase [Pseudarcicella sp.]|nr:glycosyltransferase [Pseudarcicella sp.]